MPRLAQFATACGKARARGRARTGDPIAIAAYVGRARRFDDALTEFAVSYADQTARDHQQLSDAIDGRAVEGSTEMTAVVLVDPERIARRSRSRFSRRSSCGH